MASTPVSDERTALPQLEESLEVGRREVDLGGYRITKRVDSREEVVDELLHGQRAEIERRPIGRQLEPSEVPKPRYEGDTFVVPVVEEVMVAVKRLVLVEEVRIRRVHTTHRLPQRVTLRKEEIAIERLEASGPPPTPPPPPQGPASPAQQGNPQEKP